MMLFVLLLIGAALTLFLYLKNKQADREYNRRIRRHEQQDELMETLRNRKKEPEIRTDDES